ncbi:unnamed protein product [Polarella glacialis]|uniref:Uncharacterized protein n=1 Tax=Polarella glacialis TaxID=89957 RepID=A0A813LYE0_POLGL|nr:unnamed protein product [Polarella glacialis]
MDIAWNEDVLTAIVTKPLVIYASPVAFAAVQNDGSVVTWGEAERGGDSSAVQAQLQDDEQQIYSTRMAFAAAQLQGDVQQIYSTDQAFAAVKSDGSVVTWGLAEHGGDSSEVQAQLQGDVQQIYSTNYVFSSANEENADPDDLDVSHPP